MLNLLFVNKKVVLLDNSVFSSTLQHEQRTSLNPVHSLPLPTSSNWDDILDAAKTTEGIVIFCFALLQSLSVVRKIFDIAWADKTDFHFLHDLF